MTIPKNTIGSHVGACSRDPPHGYRQRAKRAEASAVRAFEREARVARRVRDLELVRRRLGGREVPLGSKPGRARGGRADASGCARPREDLDRAPDGAGRAHEAREVARSPGAFAATTFAASEDATIGAMAGAAARVLLEAMLAAVLVRADRDVLGADGKRRDPAAEREGCGKKSNTGSGYLTRPAESRDRRSMRAATAVPKIAASTLGFSNRKRACGERGARWGGARTPPRARSAHGGPACAGEPREPGAACGGRDVERAVLVAHGASPRSRPVHEHAVLKRHPSEPDRCLSHAQTLPAVLPQRRLQRVGRRPAGKRAPVDLDERHESSRTEDDVKASASSTRSRGYAPSSTRYPLPGASSITAARVTPARMPSSSDGVDVSPARHQRFVTVPSRTIPSASTKSASSAPRRRASASAAMLTA